MRQDPQLRALRLDLAEDDVARRELAADSDDVAPLPRHMQGGGIADDPEAAGARCGQFRDDGVGQVLGVAVVAGEPRLIVEARDGDRVRSVRLGLMRVRLHAHCNQREREQSLYGAFTRFAHAARSYSCKSPPRRSRRFSVIGCIPLHVAADVRPFGGAKARLR